MASVRAIVPGQITDEQLFQPLTAALERYPKESYEVVIGAAGKVDTGSKTVLVSLPGSSQTISYDQLVVATGSRSTTSTVPWKILDSYDETVSNLDATRERVKEAKHIVVAGAGATGVEVAGELGCEYGKDKEVILLSGGPSLLDGDSVGPAALAELKKLHVNVRFDARVTGSKELPDGKTEVALQGGETITTDLYLPTMGMRANSEMLDQSYLTDKGYVSVDEYYRVKGLEKDGVWALGDVVSVPRAGFLFTQKQVS
jgi:apoptosis-inducing factor 2